jgi:hypothetical protein
MKTFSFPRRWDFSLSKYVGSAVTLAWVLLLPLPQLAAHVDESAFTPVRLESSPRRTIIDTRRARSALLPASNGPAEDAVTRDITVSKAPIRMGAGEGVASPVASAEPEAVPTAVREPPVPEPQLEGPSELRGGGEPSTEGDSVGEPEGAGPAVLVIIGDVSASEAAAIEGGLIPGVFNDEVRTQQEDHSFPEL